MSDEVKVRIGGEEITLPLILNFATLERAWPAIKVMADEGDPIARVSAACGILAALLVATRPELSVVEIKKRLLVNRATKTDERPGLLAAVDQIVVASGLFIPGEDKPAEVTEETPPASPTISTSNTSSTDLPAAA